MGWTSFQTDRPTKDIIADELNFSNEHGSGRVLAIATKLNVSYVAYQRTEPSGKKYVNAVVVLHNRKDGEFCYKVMDETAGPCESNCPVKILVSLSPIESFAALGTNSHEWATNWRARCYAAIEKQQNAPGDGATIRFKEPIKFTDGTEGQTFTVRKTGRKVRFIDPSKTYNWYRISNWKQREYAIV
jgi:hypothetical protein